MPGPVLRARNGNVAAALKMLVSHVEWRAGYRPWEITPAGVELEARTGKVRSVGCDRHGRQGLYTTPSYIPYPHTHTHYHILARTTTHTPSHFSHNITNNITHTAHNITHDHTSTHSYPNVPHMLGAFEVEQVVHSS